MTKPRRLTRFSYLDAQPRQRRPAQLPLIVTTYRRHHRWTDHLQWNGSSQSGNRGGFRWHCGRHPYLKSAMYPPCERGHQRRRVLIQASLGQFRPVNDESLFYT